MKFSPRWISAVAVAASLIAAAASGENEPTVKFNPADIIGCWEHIRYAQSHDGPPKQIGSHLMCFNGEGIMSGVTFDAGDGWDWNQYYRLEDNRVAVYAWEDQKYNWHIQFVIKQISKSEMVVESTGETLIFKLVCRAEQEDVQCGRMKETIEQPTQNEAQ